MHRRNLLEAWEHELQRLSLGNEVGSAESSEGERREGAREERSILIADEMRGRRDVNVEVSRSGVG